MAMAVLGLGLGIIRGIRGRADSFLDFDIDLSEDASATKRIANLKEELTLKAGDEFKLGISFYNVDNICYDSGSLPGSNINLVCSGIQWMTENGDAPDGEDAFRLVQAPTRIPVGEPGKMLAKIIPNKFLEKTSYACSFQVICGEDDEIVAETPVFVDVTA